MVTPNHPSSTEKLSLFFIPITFFFTGLIAVTTQTILLRELLVVALGNEIIFGLSLSNWLMGIFFGALLGGWISNKSDKIREIFIASLLLMILMIPVSITLIRNLYQISGTLPGTHIDFFVIFLFSAFIILPIGFFIGFTFPLASNLEKGDKSGARKKIVLMSNVYIFEALGFLVGGFLTSFFLVEHFNSYFAISLVTLPLLIFLAFKTRKLGHKRLFVIVITMIILDIFSLSPWGSRSLNHKMIQNRWDSISGSKLVLSTNSRFQNIAVGRHYEQFNIYCNGQLSTIFPEKNDSLITAAHLMSQHPDPKNILILGEAISGLAQQLLKFNIQKITSVEIDAKLISILKTYLPDSEKRPLFDKRFAVTISDGKKWIKSRIKDKGSTGLFDLIFINLSEPSTLFLNRYYTVEFYQDLSRILQPDGVLGIKITSSENYVQGFVSDYTTTIYRTLRQIFPHIVIAPGEKNYFFASKNAESISDSPEILARRYDKTGASPRNLSLIFKSIYPAEKTAFIKNFLESNKSKIVNTDEKPISLFYYNKILGWINNQKTENFFKIFEKVNIHRIAIFIAILVLIRLLYIMARFPKIKTKPQKREAGLRFHIILCSLNGGFFGLSLELFIIYSFQNIAGYIYQIIGVIIALFMAGLPVGAWLSSKMIRSTKTSRKNQLILLLVLQAVMIIVSISFPFILTLFNLFYTISNLLFFILTIIIGIIIGAIFPLALSLHFSNKHNMGKTAGKINAADHLGAALGAFLSGAILLPILGLTICCLLLALLSFATALLLIADLILVKRMPPA